MINKSVRFEIHVGVLGQFSEIRTLKQHREIEAQ